MQGAGGVGGLLAVNELSIINSQLSIVSFYPTYDGNGNVSEYLDSAGVVQAHYEYDAFGNTLVSTGSKVNDFAHRFSTKPLDAETGLYYYGYRYYDPVTGRWINRDPIGEDGGLNLYGFVDNDGVNLFDYLGLIKPNNKIAHDHKAMLDTVHKESIKAHKAAEAEYLAQLKLEDPKIKRRMDNGRVLSYIPKMPKEYGGRVCENCKKDANGKLTYTYYLTKTDGSWPQTRIGASMYVTRPVTDCTGVDKTVGFWHTHPSSLKEVRTGNTNQSYKYKYYWTMGLNTSTSDDNLKNHFKNPDRVPFYMTRRSGVSNRDWSYDTVESTGRAIVRQTAMKPEWVSYNNGERMPTF